MAIYKSLKDFSLSNLQIGDLVTHEIVTSVCEPNSRIHLKNFAQGAELRKVYDTLLQKSRPIHKTFLLMSNGFWRYCGECFFFEREQRWFTSSRKQYSYQEVM